MSRANESAYPANAGVDCFGNQYVMTPGLTKREHFAALAMQGLLAIAATDGHSFEQIATVAVRNADALLAALANPVSE